MQDRSRGVITIALVGNPNAGKSSIFNRITGSNVAVGNWAGVTVEKRVGRVEIEGVKADVVDLPGTYSLSAYSEEEVVARDFIIKEKPDVIIDVVDATALEHNLFLTIQIIELGYPVVLCLNMIDETGRCNIEVDADKLGKILGVSVVETVGLTGEGTRELLRESLKAAQTRCKSRYTIDYGTDIETSTLRIQGVLQESEVSKTSYPLHFFAHKLLERDSEVERLVETIDHSEIVHDITESEIDRLRSIYGDDVETLVVDRIYSAANGLARQVVKEKVGGRNKVDDTLDTILTHRFFGVIIFLAIIWVVFQFTFLIGTPVTGLLSKLFEALGNWFGSITPTIPWLSGLLKSVIADGVGGVISFLPNIAILFILFSMLEDSGYMARVAFVMDGIMNRIGLSGKASIPFVVGFGCSVPAVMSTRTLDTRRERILTTLTAPLVTCSARMEVFVFLASIFFGGSLAGNVVWMVVALGVVEAILIVKLFSLTLFKHEKPMPLLIELPHYRIPTMRSALLHTWGRLRHFLEKAASIILVGSVIFWFLSNLPWGVSVEQSLIGHVGHALEFLVKPLGLDWRAVVALLFGFVAKELVISAFNQVGGFGHGDSSAMNRWYNIPSALGLMAFINLYTPCLATLACIKAEAGWKWMWFSIAYSLALAWLTAFIIHAIGVTF